jgi:hypothetical protein
VIEDRLSWGTPDGGRFLSWRFVPVTLWDESHRHHLRVGSTIPQTISAPQPDVASFLRLISFVLAHVTGWY